MADNMNKTPNTETMQREETKSSVAGERKPEQAGFDKNRKPEQGDLDKDRKPEQGERSTQEKSAIGGGEKSQSPTGEPGQARSELESDKSRTEPTSR